MNIDICDSYEELSLKAKCIILQEIKRNENLLICAATGGSPTGTYDLLAAEYAKAPELFSHLRILKLDEWGGISMDSTSTCESYLKTHLLNPLHISDSRYIGFNSNPENPEKECKHIQEKITMQGPIDLCILGLGLNGHLALNEPGNSLYPYCHVAKLSSASLQHSMVSGMPEKPAYGLTLGMADILSSKMIVILINGSQKKAIVRKFLSREITCSVPASFLWLHTNVTCLIVKDSVE
jgi:galactosamine-6-phosphate isomerase